MPLTNMQRVKYRTPGNPANEPSKFVHNVTFPDNSEQSDFSTSKPLNTRSYDVH